MGRVNGNQQGTRKQPEPEEVGTLLPVGPEGRGRGRTSTSTEDIYSARAVSAGKATTGNAEAQGHVPGHLQFPLRHCSFFSISH